MMAICTAVCVSSNWMPLSPMRPRSISHRENSPLGASGMRQATVRMRNEVKLGTTTKARMTARHFSLTLNAAKYATGRPISRHINVAITEMRSVALNVLKKVSSKTSE